MYKITTVCVAGIGTSMIARDIVSKAVEKLGYGGQVSVEACELGSAGSLDCDLIVTSKELGDKIPPSFISIVTDVAPASIAFSTSSFTTEAGRSITSPAAILSIVT